MATGRVSKLFADKGYGFIELSDARVSVFFHMSAVMREPGWGFGDIRVGDELDFDVSEDSKGPRADNITKV